MKIRLVWLELDNFKGIKSFVFEPDGQSISIHGTNGAGKTTLYDAYSWLLFGKDSAGRSDSAFDVKPYGQANPVTTVTGRFDLGVNGEVTLTRQLAEKTVRQRGTDETSIKNEYKFSIDGVPKTKTQYDKYISELCPSNYFRMVSDPDFFAGKLKWDERRSILTQLFGDVDEVDLISRSDDFAALREAAGNLSISDYRTVITGERKKVKAELDAMPDRIEEATRAIPVGVGVENDAEMLADIEKNIHGFEDSIRDLPMGRGQLQLDVSQANAAIEEARAEYARECAGLVNTEERDRLAAESSKLVTERVQINRKISDAYADRDRLFCDLESLRKKYKELNELSWNKSSGVCPTCNRPLPQEEIDRKVSEFNMEKSEKIENNVADGKAKAAALKENEALIAELERRRNDVEKRIETVEESIKDLSANIIQPPAFETTGKYRELAAASAALQEKLDNFDSAVKEKRDKLQAELMDLRGTAAEIRERIAMSEIAVKQKARVEELKARGRELGKRAAELDRLLDAAARFEQYKLSAIEDSVNDRFTYAKFRLFDRQLNGGYTECCEVVVDGAPYSTNLNPGKKINAGLDIIRTLSEAVDFSTPVWVDNAESYVTLIDVDAQVIRLQVDADAKTLTVKEN